MLTHSAFKFAIPMVYKSYTAFDESYKILGITKNLRNFTKLYKIKHVN